MQPDSCNSQPGWQVRLQPDALSPDPTYLKRPPSGDSIDYFIDVFPWKLVSCLPAQPAVEKWADRLDGERDAGELTLHPDSNGHIDITVDFGTELEGSLEVVLKLSGRTTMMSLIGEFLMEVEGYFYSEHPKADAYVHFESAGIHTWKRAPQGFRYARLLFHDVKEPLTIKALKSRSQFVFRDRPGDFHCDNPRYQRAWQTSVYTARLCTRPDTFWDGIKRDRGGWFGDARIIKEAVDSVFHDPRPSHQMLSSLPVDEWVNGVPVYSFDAIAMLRQHILTFGKEEPCVQDAYSKVKAFLQWVAEKQLNPNGLIIRDPSLDYFQKIGFVDWSRMPVGGRFEELCWLQCKHVEGLRMAAQIANWLGRSTDATQWETRASKISACIMKTFWRNGRGFIHTLNHVGEVPNPHVPGWGGHYEKTYEEKIRLGESGPTRQSNTLAVLANIPNKTQQKQILEQVFKNPEIEPVITAYFLYYEQMARAACGDKTGALTRMYDYLADLLEDRNAATLIEMYDPRVKDFRRFCNHFEVTWTWPLSYCHGWGAGLVPLSQMHLSGITSTAPGWTEMSIEAPAEIPMAFETKVPTPHGIIEISREAHTGSTNYKIPSAIKVSAPSTNQVMIDRI